MAHFIKFPSIEQFRSVVSQVQKRSRYVGKNVEGDALYDLTKAAPILTFTGTVKLHGTNAAVIYNKATGYYRAQSRERLLSLESDNAGFCMFTEQKRLAFQVIFERIYAANKLSDDAFVVIYGEWCGEGIQSKVALSQLPKMFVAFDIYVFKTDKETFHESAANYDNGCWLTSAANLSLLVDFNYEGIYSINQFPTYVVEIDFNKPEEAIPFLQQQTIDVEEECPVGKHFGVTGVGEGIVWSFLGVDRKDYLRFKVKGEKHQSSKVKKLLSVDVEKMNAIAEFADYAVTESRLMQGLEHLRMNNLPLSIKSTGEFIKWVQADVLKEEQDTIVANSFNVKAVNTALAVKAKTWFIQNGVQR